MRVPNEQHEAHGWVMGRIAPDFELLDAWALPAEGEREDFDAFLRTMAAFDPAETRPSLSHLLWRVRERLGALLGWDDPAERLPIPGCRETSLADRLPPELRGSADDPMFAGSMRGGFTPLYRTDDEVAAEISNQTVHGVLQIGWVPYSDGRYRARMGVYVKPRGTLGSVYLKLIQPFRHLVVYPSLTRRIGRAWDARARREHRGR